TNGRIRSWTTSGGGTTGSHVSERRYSKRRARGWRRCSGPPAPSGCFRGRSAHDHAGLPPHPVSLPARIPPDLRPRDAALRPADASCRRREPPRRAPNHHGSGRLTGARVVVGPEELDAVASPATFTVTSCRRGHEEHR